jgi:hypothetical protein
MTLSNRTLVALKTERLGETLVNAHYLALELRNLALDSSFIDQRASALLADLLHAWAKKQESRIADGRPCFRELRLASSNEQPSAARPDHIRNTEQSEKGPRWGDLR